jgi:hypothetical protein
MPISMIPLSPPHEHNRPRQCPPTPRKKKRSEEKEDEMPIHRSVNRHLQVPPRAILFHPYKRRAVNYHDNQGRRYVPLSPKDNKKEINEIPWLSAQILSQEYNSNTDVFLFVLAASPSSSSSSSSTDGHPRESLTLDQHLHLYDAITHDLKLQGVVLDMHSFGKPRTISLIMLRRQSLAVLENSPGTALLSE